MTAGAAPSSGRWARAIDPAIFLALFAGYLAALLATASTLGYARDEGFYFHAAGTYGRWFEILLSDPGRALEHAVVDRYWRENSEHPALMKSLFWASHRLFHETLIDAPGTALRLPAMALSSLAVATVFAFGRRCIGRAGGLVAALSFALMPRVFHHSHLACFDMPIAALWLFVVYAYYRSLGRRGWPWAIACALLYGLALDTKHNAWFLPLAPISHAALLALARLAERSLRGRRLRREQAASQGQPRREPPRPGDARRLRFPLAIVLMLTLGPLVMYALWPWIWHDTQDRLAAYAEFHLEHVFYNMEFLGKTYFEPPFPLSYAPLMTAATLPAITLLLAAAGGLCALVLTWRAARELRLDVEPAPGEPLSPFVWGSLWLACIGLSYGPWVFDDTPIFGGTKHWLSAYPFLALFAGQGFVWLAAQLRAAALAAGWRSASTPRFRPLLSAALAACALAAPLAITWGSHPWGLSAYTPLVGGAPGAATLGLNRSFWGYTTGAVTDFLNEAVGRRERLFLHDTAYDSFKMLQRDGRLRRDIRGWGTVSGSHVALYHHEQHMSRVEHMIWVDYGTTAPAHVGAHDGVPVIWVYERPSR